jgi:hypothetical protein
MKAGPVIIKEVDEKEGKKPLEAITFTIIKIIAIRCSSTNPPEPFKHFEEVNTKVSNHLAYGSRVPLI